MRITTYDPKKNKEVFVGTLIGNVFIRKVSSKHFMRILQAYGIQKDVVEKLNRLDCEYVLFETNRRKLLSAFNQWLGEDSKTLDFGHGKQVFLPVNKMINKENNA